MTKLSPQPHDRCLSAAASNQSGAVSLEQVKSTQSRCLDAVTHNHQAFALRKEVIRIPFYIRMQLLSCYFYTFPTYSSVFIPGKDSLWVCGLGRGGMCIRKSSISHMLNLE